MVAGILMVILTTTKKIKKSTKNVPLTCKKKDTGTHTEYMDMDTVTETEIVIVTGMEETAKHLLC